MIPCHCTSVCKGVNERKDSERVLFSSSVDSLSVWRGVGKVIWLQVLCGFCHWVALHSPAGAEICFPEWKLQLFALQSLSCYQVDVFVANLLNSDPQTFRFLFICRRFGI